MASYNVKFRDYDCSEFVEPIIASEITTQFYEQTTMIDMGGNNVLLSNAESIINQFIAVHSAFPSSKDSPVIKFNLSFSLKYDDVCVENVKLIAREFCKFLKNYQVIFMIKERDSFNSSGKSLFITFLINTRNIDNGKTMKSNINTERVLAQQVACILGSPFLWQGKHSIRLVSPGSTPDNMNYINY